MRKNAFVGIRQALLMIEEAFTELMNLHHIYCEKSNRFHNQLWMYAHGIASMVATNFCDWDI